MRLVIAALVMAPQVFVPAARADDFHETLLVRQMAAAAVFVSMCPSITLGPGVEAIRNELQIEMADMQPGGRYYDLMVKAASDLKAVKAIAGTDNPGDACPEALKTYGPEGSAYRNLVKPK
jgi:hypothetical protein